MSAGDTALALRETMVVVLKLGGPTLIAALVIGVIMSLFQAITQLNEATLAFVPKAMVVIGTLILTGQFMLTTMTDYAQALFDRMVAIGGL